MNTVVVAWGRMNPITVGHEKLVKALKQKAREVSATPLLFLSKSHDKDKNPLDYNVKVALAKYLFGDIVQEDHSNNIVDILKTLSQSYSDIILICGQDRISSFEDIFKRCIPKHFHFDSYQVISAGDRNDSSTIEGVSGSKLREYVHINNYSMFKYYTPKPLQFFAREIFFMIQDDDNILQEYVLNFQQRYKRALAFRRKKNLMRIARERMKSRPADYPRLKRRARADAIAILKAKYLGRDRKYDDLSLSQKMQVDKVLDRKKAIIDRIAARLIPTERQNDIKRLHSLQKNKVVREAVNEKFENTFISESINNKFNNLFDS